MVDHNAKAHIQTHRSMHALARIRIKEILIKLYYCLTRQMGGGEGVGGGGKVGSGTTEDISTDRKSAHTP